MFKRKKIKGFIKDELTGRVIVDLHSKSETIENLSLHLTKKNLTEFYKYDSLCINGYFYYKEK